MATEVHGLELFTAIQDLNQFVLSDSPTWKRELLLLLIFLKDAPEAAVSNSLWRNSFQEHEPLFEDARHQLEDSVLAIGEIGARFNSAAKECQKPPIELREVGHDDPLVLKEVTRYTLRAQAAALFNVGEDGAAIERLRCLIH